MGVRQAAGGWDQAATTPSPRPSERGMVQVMGSTSNAGCDSRGTTYCMHNVLFSFIFSFHFFIFFWKTKRRDAEKDALDKLELVMSNQAPYAAVYKNSGWIDYDDWLGVSSSSSKKKKSIEEEGVEERDDEN